ncbi:ABC transporter substrate-binding protein [Roseiarcaceae bacterium H3SJ34-1]|uniref:ABC transporter substrate-binding protein n=1 Tax=Terripilifer ovatus TaxID=3032367 RepID=UPI003AB94820|nr:ABC transporter substrate-binding protein [Roseiarcaceae bacterium H3SJ34-1]
MSHETHSHKNGHSIDRRMFTKGAGSALALLAAPHVARAQALRKVRFITPFNFSLSYASVFYAQVGGFFAKEGLDVEVINGKGAATAAQLVIAGQAEIARTGGANYITSRVDSNAPLVSVATIAQISPFYMVSSPAAPLKDAKDLAGKTIGVATLGGSMEGTLNLLLRGDGVDGSKVERVRVADVAASYGLIEAKRIAGFMASVSSVVKIRAAIPQVQTFPIDDGIPGQVYVATPQKLAADPDLYVRFLRAEYKAIAAILDAGDLEPIVRAIGKSYEIPGIDDMATSMADLKQNAATWTAKGRQNVLRNVPEQWADAAKVMAETGMIKSPAVATTLYDNSARDKAVG